MDIGPKSDLIFEYLKLWKVEHFDNLKTKHFLLRLVESIESNMVQKLESGHAASQLFHAAQYRSKKKKKLLYSIFL